MGMTKWNIENFVRKYKEKYDNSNQVVLTFDEIETMLECELPYSAKKWEQYWHVSGRHGGFPIQILTKLGCVMKPNIDARKVVFIKEYKF